MKPIERDENQQLLETLGIIQGNIRHYEKRVEEVKQETGTATFFSVFKELYLSPTFLLSCAVFLCLAFGIFEK